MPGLRYARRRKAGLVKKYKKRMPKGNQVIEELIEKRKIIDKELSATI